MRSDQINTNVMFHDHIRGHVGLLMKKKKKKTLHKKGAQNHVSFDLQATKQR